MARTACYTKRMQQSLSPEGSTAFTLTPLACVHLGHAVHTHRLRRVEYTTTFAGLTLTDGTVIKICDEEQAWIAIRCLASSAHAGKTPAQARTDERVSFGSLTAPEKETAPNG